MNPNLARLQPYPFEKLRRLLAGVEPPADKQPISLGIGEPRHPAPPFVAEVIAASLDRLSSYPLTGGMPELSEAAADWLVARFGLRRVDPETQVLPVNGTREALFAFAQAVIDPTAGALVIAPNPFYQIYEGAALLAGAELAFVDCREETGFLPDFERVTGEQWRRCQLLYICTPGNPTGAVLPLEQLQRLIRLAREYDFVIASDECYSEIYFDEDAPPPGLLQACAALGDDDYRNCVVFHSLSKRSNLPGLRSGFVAGDAAILDRFLLYRTYHGCSMPPHHQLASIAAWRDEDHVRENREQYRQKFTAFTRILDGCLDVTLPDAGFYLWPKTPGSAEDFARALYAGENVIVLPGDYLGRESAAGNPGAGRVRMALVAEPGQCEEAARRIVACLRNYPGDSGA